MIFSPVWQFKRFWLNKFFKYFFKRRSDENYHSPVTVDTGSAINIWTITISMTLVVLKSTCDKEVHRAYNKSNSPFDMELFIFKSTQSSVISRYVSIHFWIDSLCLGIFEFLSWVKWKENYLKHILVIYTFHSIGPKKYPNIE